MFVIVVSTLIALLMFTCSNAQIVIKLINEGDKSTSSNYTEIAGNFSMDIDKMSNRLAEANSRWEKELADQKRCLKDLYHILLETEDDHSKPSSCADALEGGKPSGIYTLYLPESEDIEPFEVYCLSDYNNGSAWTVIQRREDGSVDFFRGWYDYKRGFGNTDGEFWIGLDKLHALTNLREHELWIELTDFEGVTSSVRYDSFAIGNEESAYRLNVVGLYSGTIGDSLTPHMGAKFSTKDNDNDYAVKSSCANYYKGAWWFMKCHHSDLNGEYLRGAAKTKDENGKGVFWHAWRGHYSLKYSHMAIRPKL